ncbi:hypothetical protein ACFRSX_06395 [Streptomyces goshikiensis]|uniref:hypothetical protein n=1 Tax=Streptomyces TaxID=1883 RepID=UPI000C276C6C|nr:hypothetical protein [Streptomyces sp. CB02120-2]PJN15611.1 hypothetical protein CG724_27615 [Streptomyces sp. CB02120-2]
MERQELKRELDATLEARRELGSEYESALVESFVEKVDTQVRRRLAEERLGAARGGGGADRASAATGAGVGAVPGSGTFGERFGFAIVTLVLAVPLSAIGAAQARLSGLVVVWAGIVAVNLIHARSPRGRARGVDAA